MMRTYKITKNGYLIGKAKDKNKAVKFIISDIKIDDGISPQWETSNGRILCLNGHDEYIISEDKGD